MKAWLRFFRVVNLPTVPGDVFAGAAAMVAGGWAPNFAAALAAAGASVFIYMFGLADNDIVGAATDRGRPIPDGEISLRAAKIAAVICLCGAVACGAFAHLPWMWWIAATTLALLCAIYNRTKSPALMGLCRGLNATCGGAAVAGWGIGGTRLIVLALVWTIYIAEVTKYSEGEESDPEKKRRVGLLIGGIVYLQLTALLVFHSTPELLAGAVMLILLRLVKSLMPEVSAS